ncbi:MAG: ANTAR domain-containing protein [Actinomycetota bacterium]|nr:ANTAR domain-containing protein [Actinomycetota bacterium]
MVIEQAKGILAASLGVDMQRAFSRLRARARNNNQKLGDVANRVIARTLSPGALNSPSAERRSPPGTSAT